MAFKFRCPFCNTKLEAEDEWEGQDCICPKCSREVAVEREPEIQTSVNNPLPLNCNTLESDSSPELCLCCPECKNIIFCDTNISSQEILCPSCSETVIYHTCETYPCPFCGEQVRLKARICKHCRKTLPGLSNVPRYSYHISGKLLERSSQKQILSPTEKQKEITTLPLPSLASSQSSPKSTTTYILLALFLGCLGIHDFYAGYTNQGIIKLCISVVGCCIGLIISVIWAFIDLCTVRQDASGQPFI